MLVGLFLTACGGSSDSGGATPGPVGQTLKITITPVLSSVPANTNDFPINLESPFYTQVNIRVTFDNGAPVADGTEVQFRTSNVQIAPISTLDDPETTDVNEFTTLFGSVFNETSGGNATFFVHGGQLSGSVTLTASAVDPQTGRTSFSDFNFTVSPGPEPFERFTIEAQTTSLPANIFNLTPIEAFETVYMTEATISFKDPLGNFVNPASDGDSSTVGVAVSNTNVITFSTLDDGSTDDVNEIFVLLGQGPVDMVAGRGTIFIWSQQPGIGTITVSTFDQYTGEDISITLDIEVEASGNGMPTDISVFSNTAGYINGSGGPQAQAVQVQLRDADGLAVIDPGSNNNIIVDITTDGPNSGEFVSATNAQGVQEQGNSIKLASANGVGSLALHSGDSPNTVIMTVTSDRADNNVDNGLQDPITAQNSFVISDGVLFGLEITIPDLQNFFVNGVTDLDLSAGTGQLDGTYTLGISVIGTDKGGNPALPTTIQFGLIDSPLDGYPNEGPGVFAISGVDGDPQEGGNQFTSESANFFDDANGVQPGDTLLIWAEDIQGNEDLESAVTVQNVNSQTRLTINELFNRNDLTGQVIDDMDIFPYAVGRALDGNIEATATLGDNGVATTYLNFPVSKLGKLAGIYAKGAGATVNGSTRIVTDVETIVYPGLGSIGDTHSANLFAFPEYIAANQESLISVCMFDAAGHPLQGRSISWAYAGEGTGIIDGVANSGVMSNSTGADGCAQGIAIAQGVLDDSENSGFVFSSGGLTCLNEDSDVPVCIRIADPGSAYLTADPTFVTATGSINIDLLLFDGGGNGIPGSAILVDCQANGGTLEPSLLPGITDENGMSFATIVANLNAFNEFYTGVCTFSTPGGAQSVDVNFQGIDICTLNFSPNPPPAVCEP